VASPDDPSELGSWLEALQKANPAQGCGPPYLDPLLTLDDLLADEVMAPVLRSAGYEPD
jgi:hypothetical protein